jgi:hypothetical protein
MRTPGHRPAIPFARHCARRRIDFRRRSRRNARPRRGRGDNELIPHAEQRVPRHSAGELVCSGPARHERERCFRAPPQSGRSVLRRGSGERRFVIRRRSRLRRGIRQHYQAVGQETVALEGNYDFPADGTVSVIPPRAYPSKLLVDSFAMTRCVDPGSDRRAPRALRTRSRLFPPRSLRCSPPGPETESTGLRAGRGRR